MTEPTCRMCQGVAAIRVPPMFVRAGQLLCVGCALDLYGDGSTEPTDFVWAMTELDEWAVDELRRKRSAA